MTASVSKMVVATGEGYTTIRDSTQWAREQGLDPLPAGGEADRMQSIMAAVLALHRRTESSEERHASEETMRCVIEAARAVSSSRWEALRPTDHELVPGGVVLGFLGLD
ncbi:hypothetical protein D8M15_06930 [Micrococcus sp. HSID17228]|nr:hypothetical protein D8M29_08665 [Micrococcus sp. HSID17227]RUQ44553.1 hypothetical protein D8M15_06930 [Micrococcus sp. HSID17228]